MAEKKISVNLDIPTFYKEDLAAISSYRRLVGHQRFIKRIKRHLPAEANKRLIDIGCASGSFLYACQKQLPGVKLFGLEYDERLIKTAISNVPNAQITRGSSEDLEFENDSFDVVTSFQVIEHVYDPESMAREMLRVLKPNGILVITTPNLSGLGRRLERSAWHGFRDDHVSLKSYDDWCSLFSLVGFKEIATRSTFFSGIKIFQRLPLSLVNQSLLYAFGYANWSYGESFVGFYTK